MMAMSQFDGSADHPYDTKSASSVDRLPGGPHSAAGSPTKGNKKTVTFEFQYAGAPDIKGRLPLRVGISPHDTTDSIITVVKNFYGIYDRTVHGISFEDKETGITLIPRFENFEQDMHVVVRIVPTLSPAISPRQAWALGAGSPNQTDSYEPAQAVPSYASQVLQQPPPRPASRLARKNTASPKLAATPNAPRYRARPGTKNAKNSFQEGLDELNDSHNGYSSGDGGPGSVSSSRLVATAEISADNIVEGGRRQQVKFDSSELPLYVPPQMPAPHSISSVSPQRRSGYNEHTAPFKNPAQKNFSYSLPLPSPQSYTFEQPQAGSPGTTGGFQVPAVPKHGGRSLRDRTSGASVATNRSSLGGTNGNSRKHGGILPTPDPTVASTISDEDVALQLMRLSDMSNFSHGRISGGSAMDDALSGRAEAASSASDNDNNEDEQPLPVVHPSTEHGHYDHHHNGQKGVGAKRSRNAVHELPSYDSIEHTADEADADADFDASIVFRSELDASGDEMPRSKVAKTKSTTAARSGSAVKVKAAGSRGGGGGKSTANCNARTPSMSTATVAGTGLRKGSSASMLTFAHQPGADEDDLSSKPRCQRCRKSKKGCDRQRPCARCKDAGIGADGCVSEDEGNGRKGRYGRHMGVPVKKGMVRESVNGGGPVSGAKGETGVSTPDPEVKAAGAVLKGMAAIGGGIQAQMDLHGTDGAAKKRKRT